MFLLPFYRAKHAMLSTILLLQVVHLSVHPSVTLRYRGHIHVGWTSSKVITQIISSSHLRATTSAIWSKGNTPKFGWNRGVSVLELKFCQDKLIYITMTHFSKITG